MRKLRELTQSFELTRNLRVIMLKLRNNAKLSVIMRNLRVIMRYILFFMCDSMLCTFIKSFGIFRKVCKENVGSFVHDADRLLLPQKLQGGPRIYERGGGSQVKDGVVMYAMAALGDGVEGGSPFHLLDFIQKWSEMVDPVAFKSVFINPQTLASEENFLFFRGGGMKGRRGAHCFVGLCEDTFNH